MTATKTTLKGETMKKQDLVNNFSNIEVSNWIATGDQPESRREELLKTSRRRNSNLSVRLLNKLLANITVVGAE